MNKDEQIREAELAVLRWSKAYMHETNNERRLNLLTALASLDALKSPLPSRESFEQAALELRVEKEEGYLGPRTVEGSWIDCLRMVETALRDGTPPSAINMVANLRLELERRK